MPAVLCEVHPGVWTDDASVAVHDLETNERHFLHVDRAFLTQKKGQSYLPIGVVYKDRDKGVALIEFPHEADSGSHRAWVPLSSLLDSNGDAT